jgi:hypothetical protein
MTRPGLSRLPELSGSAQPLELQNRGAFWAGCQHLLQHSWVEDKGRVDPRQGFAGGRNFAFSGSNTKHPS